MRKIRSRDIDKRLGEIAKREGIFQYEVVERALDALERSGDSVPWWSYKIGGAIILAALIIRFG